MKLISIICSIFLFSTAASASGQKSTSSGYGNRGSSSFPTGGSPGRPSTSGFNVAPQSSSHMSGSTIRPASTGLTGSSVIFQSSSPGPSAANTCNDSCKCMETFNRELENLSKKVSATNENNKEIMQDFVAKQDLTDLETRLTSCLAEAEKRSKEHADSSAAAISDTLKSDKTKSLNTLKTLKEEVNTRVNSLQKSLENDSETAMANLEKVNTRVNQLQESLKKESEEAIKAALAAEKKSNLALETLETKMHEQFKTILEKKDQQIKDLKAALEATEEKTQKALKALESEIEDLKNESKATLEATEEKSQKALKALESEILSKTSKQIEDLKNESKAALKAVEKKSQEALNEVKSEFHNLQQADNSIKAFHQVFNSDLFVKIEKVLKNNGIMQ